MAAMFSDGLFSGSAAFPQLMEESLWQGFSGGDFLEDQVSDFLEPCMESNLWWSRAWLRPRPRWCPYTCTTIRPGRPLRRHFIILPRFTSDDECTPSGGRQCHRDVLAYCKKAEGTTAKNSLHSQQQGDCSCNGRREDSSNKKRQDCSEDCRNSTRKTSECSTNSNNASPTEVDRDSSKFPWHFSVDMSGCDEVRALIEGNKLMVEGRGSSNSTHKMMRCITSLPCYVSHDSLTARLSNGNLTITQQKSEGQTLEESETRALYIKMQDEQQKKHHARRSTGGQHEASESAHKKQPMTETLNTVADSLCNVREEVLCEATAA